MIPQLILDTDMGSDCDDAGAMAVMHQLANAGEVTLLGVIHSSAGRMPWGVGVCAAINRHYGRPQLPLGAYTGKDVGDPADKLFAEDIARDTARYGHSVSSAEEASTLYVRLLRDAEDASVTIVTIGHLKVLHDLWQTHPDLLRRKVKELVVMGGAFPASGDCPEWNFYANDAAPFTKVLESWPTPVVYTGFEIGIEIRTGQGFVDAGLENPVARAYEGFHRWHKEDLAKGRPSWDQTAVLYAVRGLGSFWELSKPGRIQIDDKGGNVWSADPACTHRYLIKKASPETVAAGIEALMLAPHERNPRNKPHTKRGG